MSQQPSILLVEDTPGDVLVIKEALLRIDPSLGLEVVRDGNAALERLGGGPASNSAAKAALPGLILLDLSLPVIDGFQVLEWLRTRPDLRKIPVVVLTTTSGSPDVHRAYLLGASSFITKPSEFGKLVCDLQLALDHWLFKRLPAGTQQACVSGTPRPSFPAL